MHKDSVVDYPTGHSVDDYRSICIRKLVSFLTQFLTALANKTMPGQRETDLDT